MGFDLTKWMLVSKEPTDEQVLRGQAICDNVQPADDENAEQPLAEDVYAAMLSASDPLLTDRVAEVIEAARTLRFGSFEGAPSCIVVGGDLDRLRNAIAALDALMAGEKTE